VYLSVLAFAQFEAKRLVKPLEAVIVSACVVLFYTYSMVHTFMLDYLGHWQAVATLSFFFCLNCAFLLGQKRIFTAVMVLFTVVAGMTVNPLSRGVSPIYNKVIAQKVMDIANAHPGEKWATANSIVTGNFLVALGVKSLNSLQYYPDTQMWKTLDPSNKYEQTYNRYAHMQLDVVQTDTVFELKQQDYVILHITPENLRRTGVHYLLSTGKISFDSPLFEEIDKVDADNMYIYKVKT
jgi:hypothetical protein